MFGWLKKTIHPKRGVCVKEVHEIDYNISEKGFKKLVYEWNIRFPIDRYYRDKYNIKFNSPEHRDLSFLDMAFEFFEDRVYEELVDQDKVKYVPNIGDYIIEREDDTIDGISNEELMELFKKGAVSKLDDENIKKDTDG